MRKMFLLVVILISLFSYSAFAGSGNFEAPADLIIYSAVEIPGFSLGPMVDFMYFPWSIDIGGGSYNHLGFGGSAGIFLNFSDGLGIAVPIQVLFAGRFELIKDYPIDFDARLGIMIGSSVIFYGASNIYIHLGDFRAGIGVTFHPNPYYSSFDPYSSDILVSFIASFGWVKPVEGLKGTLLF